MLVRDETKMPVAGANVIFTVKDGGGSLLDAAGNPTTALTVTSDAFGRAKARFKPGAKTSTNTIYIQRPGEKYPVRAGENIVDAQLACGTLSYLKTPFTIFAFPDVPEKLSVDDYSAGKVVVPLAYYGAFNSFVTDKHDNPVPNISVTYTAQAPYLYDTDSLCTVQGAETAFLFTDPKCATTMTLRGECAGESASISAETNSDGVASVGVHLGNLPGAIYPIFINAPFSQATLSVHPKTQTFGNCDPDNPPAESIYIQSVYDANYDGTPIEARQAGLASAIDAKVFQLKQEEGVIVKSYPQDITVNFNVQKEGDSTYTTYAGTTSGYGLYRVWVTLLAAVYDIYGDVIRQGDALERGTHLMRRYGVDIQMPQSITMAIDANGNLTQDKQMTFTIQPSTLPDPYKAASAQFIIYQDYKVAAVMQTDTTGTPTATLARGFKFNLSSFYEAQVVLNNGWDSVIWSKKVPIDLSNLYIEKVDSEFPDVKLHWNTYYPALGDKTVVVRAKNADGTPVTGKKVKSQKVGSTPDSVTVTNEAVLNNGRAEFVISGQALGPNDVIQVSFSLMSAENTTEASVTGSWYVKNNANTNLEEVLNGEAVFTYDTAVSKTHKGETTGATADQQKLDFVQSMMNHVIVPLRRPAAESNIKNSCLVDGYYGTTTKTALEAIINGTTDPAGTPLWDTFVSHHVNEQNSLNTFAKLAKDYSNLSLTDIGMVIDREILVGLNQTEADISPTNTDIGLYEMYQADDWDGDGLSNYVEVENSLDPLAFNNNYLPQVPWYSGPPLNIDQLKVYPQGTYGNGKIIGEALRTPNNSKGYFYQNSPGNGENNTDNYAIPDTLNRIERVAREWARRHPDLAPLKTV